MLVRYSLLFSATKLLELLIYIAYSYTYLFFKYQICNMKSIFFCNEILIIYLNYVVIRAKQSLFWIFSDFDPYSVNSTFILIILKKNFTWHDKRKTNCWIKINKINKYLTMSRETECSKNIQRALKVSPWELVISYVNSYCTPPQWYLHLLTLLIIIIIYI